MGDIQWDETPTTTLKRFIAAIKCLLLVHLNTLGVRGPVIKLAFPYV